MKKLAMFFIVGCFTASITAMQKYNGMVEAPTISIQNIIDQGGARIKNGVLNLSNMGITTLEGLQNFSKNSAIAVRKINLSHNHIPKIEEKYFEIFPNLEILDLSHNNIKEVADDYFDSNKKLRKLNLSFNKIRKMAKDALEGLHSLVDLNLNHNRISNLAANVFKDTKNTISVYVKNNPIPSRSLEKIKRAVRGINIKQ